MSNECKNGSTNMYDAPAELICVGLRILSSRTLNTVFIRLTALGAC